MGFSAIDGQDMPTPALAHWREGGGGWAGEGMAPIFTFLWAYFLGGCAGGGEELALV